MPVIIDGTSGITTPSIDTTTPLITADGGTGQTSLTAGSVLVGNGTSAVNLVAAGSSGNVLTSNGTTWTSAAAAGGQLQTQIFTSPGTWTAPSGTTKARLTIAGGGGGGNTNSIGGCGGGGIVQLTGLSGSYTVTVGTGGAGSPNTASAGSGTTSSFGAIVSASGGGGGSSGTAANGTITVSAGTLLRGNNLSVTASAPALSVVIPSLLTSMNTPSAGGPAGAFSTTTGNQTAGNGGAKNAAGGDGAVVVEFVG